MDTTCVPIPQAATLAEQRRVARYLAKIWFTDDCWWWIGRINVANGYGQVRDDEGRLRVAHRVAYELWVGPIPDGLVLDHGCHNRACVRPDHLEPVTAKENTARSDSPPAINGRKTHCIHGHAFDNVNTRVQASGRRVCRRCTADRRARYRRAQARR